MQNNAVEYGRYMASADTKSVDLVFEAKRVGQAGQENTKCKLLWRFITTEVDLTEHHERNDRSYFSFGEAKVGSALRVIQSSSSHNFLWYEIGSV